MNLETASRSNNLSKKFIYFGLRVEFPLFLVNGDVVKEWDENA
jgi:hypothetical protein